MVLGLTSPKKSTEMTTSSITAGVNKNDVPEYVMPTGPVAKKVKVPETAEVFPASCKNYF